MNLNRKNSFLAVMLVVLMAVVVPIQGCSTAWVTTVDEILVAAAPALINILNIIAIAKGQPVNLALEGKINADATNLKVLAVDFASASSTAAPTACAQLQAGINVYAADEAQVLALANVSDPATQAKVITLSALVAGTVTAILAVVPNCQGAAKMALDRTSTAIPLPLKTFVSSYNETLVSKTGNIAVDAYTKSHKVHVHSKLVRVVTFGRAS